MVEVAVRPRDDAEHEQGAGEDIEDVLRHLLEDLRGCVVEEARHSVLREGGERLGHLPVVGLVVLPELVALWCWGGSDGEVGEKERRRRRRGAVALARIEGLPGAGPPLAARTPWMLRTAMERAACMLEERSSCERWAVLFA